MRLTGALGTMGCVLALAGGTAATATAGKKPPPDTTITFGPSGTVNRSTASFSFTSDDKHASFQCKLDTSSWQNCRSPVVYSNLHDGTHTFSVRAYNGNGVDPTPASVTWTIDTVPPPAPAITAPASPSKAASGSIPFTDGDSTATFTCSLDGAAAAACTSPFAYSNLADGVHTFAVTAKDPAGNTSQGSVQWTIDTTGPPAPTISARPDSVTSSTSASFAFSDREAGVGYQCALDGAAPASCTSPTSYSGLSSGSHTFTVAAADAAGNVSGTATYSWSIESDLIVNGSFEGSLSGWSGTQATLSLASDGAVGGSAARVALAAGATGQYLLFPSTRPVTATTDGWAYTAGAYVRSDTPGKQVCLRVREFANGVAINNKDECVTTTATWQKLPPLMYTAAAAGNQLTVWVYQNAGVAGDSFEVDGVSLLGGTASAPGNGDPVVVAAGDVACAPTDPDYNNGLGQNHRCMQKATADLISSIPGVTALLQLGDQQYECGELQNFNAVYALTWGRFRSITYPVPGNHEYGDSDVCPSKTNAAGYYTYWGSLAGDPTKGYYSFDIGTWHIIALNSECWAVGGCDFGSPQETWLRNDLAANPALCTLAYWHIPRWSAGLVGDVPLYDAFWQDLYNAHAELVLNGHDHSYQRYGRMNPSGVADTNGLREVVVGTGGEEIFNTPLAYRSTLPAKDNTTFGVLKLVLHPGSYDGQFLPAPGGGMFTDSFSTPCTP